MKTIGIRILIVILLLIIFKGPLFRLVFTYQPVSEVPILPFTDQTFQLKINQEIASSELDLEEIHSMALELTAETLSFTFENVSSNPNDVCKSSKANCVGYSALYTSIVNVILAEQNLEHKFQVQHLRGHVHFLGINIHQFTDSPFFQNHDYCLIRDLETDQFLYSDSSLFDCFGINCIL